MRTRGAAIQGGLAALGLVAAYATWQRQPERAPGEVVVLDATRGNLGKVRFDDGTKWVEMEQRSDAGEPAIWLHLAANPTNKSPERELRGNEGASKLWDKFSPLRATRALGTLDAAKLKELGLDAPKKKLQVTVKGQTRSFAIGTPPFNVSDPYVMDEADKRVYVLGGGVISDLDSSAVRLVDRTVHAFKPAEFDGLTVAAGNKKRELTQTTGDTPASVKLSSKKTGKVDEQAKNWHDKLWRLYVTEVLGKGEKPAGGEPTLGLRLEYFERGKQKGFLELGRVPAPAPAAPASMPTTPPPANELYARSEHTAGWVKLPPSADDLLKEADKIVAGD
jgi:hypothetical protein